MSKDKNEYLDLEYAQAGPIIVEGEDGQYTFLSNEDLVLPEPGQEDIRKEIELAKTIRKAVDNAEKYIKARKEDKDFVWGPIWMLVAFCTGGWCVGVFWILYNNGYLHGIVQ